VTVEDGRRKTPYNAKQLAVQIDPVDCSLLARACPSRATRSTDVFDVPELLTCSEVSAYVEGYIPMG
jgi:hypothetical protein